MISLIKIAAAVLVGVLLGLVVTIHALDQGLSTVVAGPWQGAPRDGTPDIDPYTLAAEDRASTLPLGVAEGLSFTARTDSAGLPLDSDCVYTLDGPMPPARFWTVSLLDGKGFPVANPAERYAFTSAEVLREEGHPLSITISPEARSGNWLPTGNAAGFILMLRLYDTGLSTIGTTFEAGSLPSIHRAACL